MQRQSSTIVLVVFLAVAYWLATAALDYGLEPATGWLPNLLGIVSPLQLVERLIVLGLLVALSWMLHYRFNRHLEAGSQWGTHFYSLYDQATLGLYRTSIDTGKVLECNQAAIACFGYPDRDTFLQEFRSNNHYVHPKDRVRLLELLAVEGRVDEFEVRVRRYDQSEFWARLDARACPGEGFIEGTISDITHEKEAHAKLHASEQSLRAIIDNSPLGISVRSRHGRLLGWNEAWRKIWGMSEEDVQADMARERSQLTLDESDKYLGDLAEDIRNVYLKGGTASLSEHQTTRRRPGAAGWIQQRFYAIYNEEGAVDRVVILTEDVTAKKQAEAERESLISELQHALEEVRALSGLLPICANCKKIRDDQGYWQQIEAYISSHSTATFTHGICPACAQELLEEVDAELD